jgi:hypothetical protein
MGEMVTVWAIDGGLSSFDQPPYAGQKADHRHTMQDPAGRLRDRFGQRTLLVHAS